MAALNSVGSLARQNSCVWMFINEIEVVHHPADKVSLGQHERNWVAKYPAMFSLKSLQMKAGTIKYTLSSLISMRAIQSYLRSNSSIDPHSFPQVLCEIAHEVVTCKDHQGEIGPGRVSRRRMQPRHAGTCVTQLLNELRCFSNTHWPAQHRTLLVQPRPQTSAADTSIGLLFLQSTLAVQSTRRHGS